VDFASAGLAKAAAMAAARTMLFIDVLLEGLKQREEN
jgi:hypothetical protein